MGIEIATTRFDEADFRRFGDRLEHQLAALRECLDRPGFGVGPRSMGAELELYIVDRDGRAKHDNQALHELAQDPQLTLELNRYNLEYNLSPQRLSDGALAATEAEIVSKLSRLGAIAETRDAAIVPIGILPTLTSDDVGRHCITDRQRYYALVEQLIKWRGSDFRIDINGAEPLQMAKGDITLEGANTSFQVHLREDPERFVDTFNALQLVTPLALAISANSPGVFGHQLWDETRIPLFKQSIDTRHPDRYRWSQPARVCFGHGWARRTPLELFARTVRLYPPLLPACGDEEDAGKQPPALDELRLHQSTVWQWNRPVYDDADGGHLRVEMRALPAGPTPVDMVAGAALLIGLAQGLRDRIDDILPALPFGLAEFNFYRSAQHGLDARLVWPHTQQRGLSDRPVTEILADMLPTAESGLADLGVSREECDRYLGVIERRLAAKTNGARWQRDCLAKLLDRGVEKRLALAGMLERYREQSVGNRPLAEWDV